MQVDLRSELFGDRNYEIGSVGHVVTLKPNWYKPETKRWCVAYIPDMRRYLVTEVRISAYLMNVKWINQVLFVGNEQDCIKKAEEMTELFLRFE